MEQGKALDWGICGIGVMPFDLKVRDALAPQDCLYTLVEKDLQGNWTPKWSDPSWPIDGPPTIRTR